MDFLVENIEWVEKEFLFWMANRTVEVAKNGKTYTLARYNVEVDGPRPGAGGSLTLVAVVLSINTLVFPGRVLL